MKTIRLKKWLKILSFIIILAFSSLFIWANWSPSTITEKLPKINIVSCDLSSLDDENSFSMIDEKFKNKKGVTACTVNSISKIASFTFNPEIVSKSELLSDLRNLGGSEVSLKVFPAKAGCPIKGTQEFFGKIKESLRVR